MTRSARLALGALSLLLALPGQAFAANISVTTTADAIGGAGCSLREAISAANDDDDGPGNDCLIGDGTDTILVPASAGDYALQIPGTGENVNTTGDLDINTNLTISGAGASSTVIEGSELDRVFDVFGSSTVELRDLTVSGGETPAGANQPDASDQAPGSGLNSVGAPGPDGVGGGGIFNTANLTLTRVSVQDNVAGDGGDAGDGGAAGSGAAGLNAGGASLGGNGGTGGNGGGIFNAGTLTLVDSSVTENNAGIGGAAGDGGAGGTGGNNGAGTGGDGGNSISGFTGSGGSGGGIFSTAGTLNITSSVIAGNAAGRGGTGGDGGDAGDGGTGTTNGGAGGDSQGTDGFFGGFGGGISQSSTALVLTDSTVRDNAAGDGGDGGNGGAGGNGGVGTSGNGAGGSSIGGGGSNAGVNGGIDSFDGSITISRSTISGNRAGDGGDGGDGGSGGIDTVTPALAGNSQGGNGAFGASTGGIGASNASGSLINVTIAENSAGAGGTGGAGGVGPKFSAGGSGQPGGSRAGLNAGPSSSFALTHSTIALNEVGAGGAGGAQGTGATPTPGTTAAAGAVGGFVSDGAIPTSNNIFATNQGVNCGGSGFSGSNTKNLEFPDNNTCPGTLNGNPLLGPLVDNGGATFTMMLGAGSDALNQVGSSGDNCQALDQRKVTRPKGAGCDVGALELSPPSVVTGAASAVTATSAKIAGTINPGQVPTTYRFQFGKTAAYGSQTTVGSAGTGGSSVAGLGTSHRPLAADDLPLPDRRHESRWHRHRRRRDLHDRRRPQGHDSATGHRPLRVRGSAHPHQVGAVRPAGAGVGEAAVPGRGRGQVPGQALAHHEGQGAAQGQRPRTKTIRLGSARFTIDSGKTKTVRIRLSRSKRRLLARSKRLRGSLSAAATDTRGGKAKTTKGKLRVSAPKRKRG